MLPTMMFALVVTGVCSAGCIVFPVQAIANFVEWGVVYSILFVALAWKISLTDNERKKILVRMHGNKHII